MNFHANIGIYLFKDSVVNGNSLEVFGIGHCPVKVKVTGRLYIFSLFTTIQSVKSYISALPHVRKL